MDFSIIIPTYNRLKDLEECLLSILSQTIKATEVIVIDDGILPDDFIAKQKDFFIIIILVLFIIVRITRLNVADYQNQKIKP